MVNQNLAAIAVLTFALSALPAKAEDKALPSNMLGFLKPGMLVGIRGAEGTTSVSLDVYTDDQYKIAQDLAAMGRSSVRAAKFAEDHPMVGKRLDDFVAQIKTPDANAEKVMMFPLLRTSFGSIGAIGDDYVLIHRDGDGNRRLVVARSSIARIDLDAQPVRFFHPSAR